MPTDLETLYRELCVTHTDIHEHLPLLWLLGKECNHITEFGTRAGNSLVAFMRAKPKRLVCYDLARYPYIDEYYRMAGSIDFDFYRQNVLAVDIEPTDMLFIDTLHTYDQLRAELQRHSCQVKKYIVIHDTTTYAEKGEDKWSRGLWPAIEEFLERGTFKVKHRRENNNGLTVLERVKSEEEGKPIWDKEYRANVYVGIPFYQDFVGSMVPSLDQGCAPGTVNSYQKWYSGGSAHCKNFNDLWRGALNSRGYGWTDFAMCHIDVQPLGFWIDGLVRERISSGADLLSAVLPIKDPRGLTSTALHRPEDGMMRRLTMHELWSKIPDITFDGPMAAKALGLEGEWELLASSGLWICDFTKPWVEQVWFEDADRIVFNPENGLFETSWVSEDWVFSSMLLSLGLKVMATKAVPAVHWGRIDFGNFRAWGTEKTDSEAGSYQNWWNWPSSNKNGKVKGEPTALIT